MLPEGAAGPGWSSADAPRARAFASTTSPTIRADKAVFIIGVPSSEVVRRVGAVRVAIMPDGCTARAGVSSPCRTQGSGDYIASLGRRSVTPVVHSRPIDGKPAQVTGPPVPMKRLIRIFTVVWLARFATT